MYVCGPTVYDRAHIGNARPAVVFDLLFRFFKHIYGSECVTYVRNFTDIDDKINDKSKITGRSIKQITDETIGWYIADMEYLNVLEPSFSPRATDFIGSMIKLISKLISKGNAYIDGKGHVYFKVKSYASYGILSKRNLEELEMGARVEISENKRDPMDFVLWKPSDEQTPGWESPWGRGRPGWHIECSAMTLEILGKEFDIHGGGIDLIFPHHENELAQSVCAHPGAKFANIWMHNGYLQIEGEKMSKSLGNFLTVDDLHKKEIDGEVIRLCLLSTHYRQPLDWTSERVLEMSAIIKKWRTVCEGSNAAEGPSTGLIEALADDLNTPLAISELHRLANEGKYDTLLASARLMGFMKGNNCDDRQASLESSVKRRIEQLLVDRKKAKMNADFVLADAIRDKFNSVGIIIQDTPEGTKWDISSKINYDKLKDL